MSPTCSTANGYDAVLANLPYVAEGAELAPEIARYEPAGALFAGPDGLDVVRRLVTVIASQTPMPALLALEIGPEQAAEVSAAGARCRLCVGRCAARSRRPRSGRRRRVVSAPDPEAFERCMSVGGVAVFPADTVYGLACDPANPVAVDRLYALKRRRRDKPSAVMFFELDLALAALPELGPDTRVALSRLLPGAVSVLLRNPAARYPLACGEDPSTLGLRVPVVQGLRGVRWPVLQSSANLADGPEARRLDEVPDSIRRAADMVIDGGELPGTASTVVDLRDYEREHRWSIVRPGAVSESVVDAALDGQFHFDPAGYEEMIREDIPVYDRLQDELVAVSGSGARRMLELGTGTGETAGRLLDRHPDAELVGIDESTGMLEVARSRLPAGQVSLHVARLQDRLPDGPFDLVASALCVHHLLADGEARSVRADPRRARAGRAVRARRRRDRRESGPRDDHADARLRQPEHARRAAAVARRGRVRGARDVGRPRPRGRARRAARELTGARHARRRPPWRTPNPPLPLAAT